MREVGYFVALLRRGVDKPFGDRPPWSCQSSLGHSVFILDSPHYEPIYLFYSKDFQGRHLFGSAHKMTWRPVVVVIASCSQCSLHHELSTARGDGPDAATNRYHSRDRRMHKSKEVKDTFADALHFSRIFCIGPT